MTTMTIQQGEVGGGPGEQGRLLGKRQAANGGGASSEEAGDQARNQAVGHREGSSGGEGGGGREGPKHEEGRDKSQDEEAQEESSIKRSRDGFSWAVTQSEAAAARRHRLCLVDATWTLHSRFLVDWLVGWFHRTCLVQFSPVQFSGVLQSESSQTHRPSSGLLVVVPAEEVFQRPTLERGRAPDVDGYQEQPA